MPRNGGFTEDANHTDTGCEVAPKCLECPLPRCRYDVPLGARPKVNLLRDLAIVDAHAAGESIEAIAERFRLSRRTVWRVTRDAKAAA